MKSAGKAKSKAASADSTDEPNNKKGGRKSLPAASSRKPRKSGAPGAKKVAKTIEKKVANNAGAGKNDRAAAMAIAIGRGVTMRPSGKWQAQLYYAGQSRYIGVFESREKATLAYEIAREILKGGNAPSQPGEAAERAVEAARKAAFEGVTDDVYSPTGKGTPKLKTTSATTPKTASSTTSTTPSTATSCSSGRSEGRSSIRAVKAAQILKDMVGKGKASSSPDATEQEEPDTVDQPDVASSGIAQNGESLPGWVETNIEAYGDRLVVSEWGASNYRDNNGWRGKDYIHDYRAPVRIVDYFARYGNGVAGLARGGEGTTLTGIVHFTSKAESHQGFCHGGSMTAVMDDVIGWTAFLATGTCQPWTGFTAQVNTSLRRPIPVDSWLVICGTISSIDGRKVTVIATLSDPANGDAVHAEGDGLVILNSGVLPSPS